MSIPVVSQFVSVFFFNDTATTEIYTLSLHDALPICAECRDDRSAGALALVEGSATFFMYQWARTFLTPDEQVELVRDRKSTRLNSSHANISYAVFCLKKKKHTTCH